jgi:hypothetical protein
LYVAGVRFETSVPVQATPAALWAALVDVESWPGLTASMSSVRKQAPGPLTVGDRVEVKQPRLPRTRWTVTELTVDRRFTWEARGPGVHTVAVHEIEPGPEGGCTLRLVLDQGGPLGPVVGRLAAGLTRRYLDLEAAGLRRRAESAG